MTIPQRDIKQFLLCITQVINNPDTVTHLLALIERNERAVERFHQEGADLAAQRTALTRMRKETEEEIAQMRLNWMAEERERRAALEKDERKANATVQPIYRGPSQPEPDAHAAAASV
jgi:hypothetical protein